MADKQPKEITKLNDFSWSMMKQNESINLIVEQQNQKVHLIE